MNTVIGTLAVDGRAVIFGTARRGLGGVLLWVFFSLTKLSIQRDKSRKAVDVDLLRLYGHICGVMLVWGRETLTELVYVLQYCVKKVEVSVFI